MPTGILTDEQLIADSRTAADAIQAQRLLDELFTRYHTRMATWCLRITGDRESAADLAQEVLLKAYRHLDSFEGNSKFSTWIYSIARNHCFNHIRGLRRRPTESRDEVLDVLVDPGSEDVLEKLIRENTQRRVLEVVHSELEELEKQVMILHYAQDLPLDAVTRLLALENASGAKAYIVSAKRKIRRALERARLTC